MINKQNLWFLTLFSLIIVLSIYYLTMPKDILSQSNIISDDYRVNVEEVDSLAVLRIERDESVISEITGLQDILLDENKTTEEKNNAYDNLKSINKNKGNEEKLEQFISDEYKLKCFVKINGEQVKVVVASNEHSTEIANNIMRFVQSKFPTKMYITVKFQS